MGDIDANTPRTERRRFNRAERVALIVAAGFKCSVCGDPLGDDWEADHVVPYSHGGKTQVSNGQATCRSCNRKKGDRVVTQLHAWQRDFVDELCSRQDPDFLLVATMAAGKTMAALAAAVERGGWRYLVVVTPTTYLTEQWARAAHKEFGLKLKPNFENGKPITSEEDGICVTYQSVVKDPHYYRQLLDRKTMVVLDEVHHCAESENMAWGPAIREAFGDFDGRRSLVLCRLGLSGTPFREDGHPIFGVRYEGDPPTSVADYSYSYSDALRDRIVRPIAFQAFDGIGRWLPAGAALASEGVLSEVRDTELSIAVRSILRPESEWMKAVLREAYETLRRYRAGAGSASDGLLVVAGDQWHAHQYARILSQMSGRHVPVAVSDDPKAKSVIDSFAKSNEECLVAVRMVSEGVDIPRLRVGVFASNIRTEVFFRQVVGRFVRKLHPEDFQAATLFIPSVAPLLEFAHRIENERDHVLAEMESRDAVLADGVERTASSLTILPGIDAYADRTIFAGEDYSGDELQRASALAESVGLDPVPDVQVARLLRRASGDVGFGSRTAVIATPPAHFEVKKDLQDQVKALVGRFVYVKWGPRQPNDRYQEINGRLNRAVGERSIDYATVESLRRRVELLEQWIGELGE